MHSKEKKLHAFFEPLTLIIPFLLTSCYLASVVGKNTHIARSSNESLKTLSTRKNNCTHINFFFCHNANQEQCVLAGAEQIISRN